VTTDEDDEFEIKVAPFEYAIVFLSKKFFAVKAEERERFFDEAVKNAVKVTIRTNETEKITLKFPK